jgi:hypothetical protein
MRDTDFLLAPENATHHGMPDNCAAFPVNTGSYLADPVRKKSGKCTNRISNRDKKNS